MFAIFKRELKSYFYSPIAFVLIGIFTLISSVFFNMFNVLAGNSEINGTLGNTGIILVIIIPILTMRILAEDKKNGSDVLLLTSPTSLFSIIFGKFLASYFVFLVMNIVTLVYPMILFNYGQPTISQVIGGYLGFLLLGGAFVAVGIFASSVTESQIIAALLGFALSLAMFLMEFIAGSVGGSVARVLNWISILSRYSGFGQGMIELSAVIYYLSFIGIFLFLTIRVIEKRRWSQS